MRKRESGFVGFRKKCGPVFGFSLPAGCPDFGRCCRRGVQGRRYSSFHIRPLWVERFIAREGKPGSPCLGGERGPSNDAESLGYRGRATFRFRGNPVSGFSECSLRGENGLANRTTCCLSVRGRPRDKRQASQSADRRSGRFGRAEGTLSGAILFQKSVYPGAEQREVVLDRIGSVERPERGGDLLDGLPVVLLSGEQSERAAHMARMHVERQIERCRGIDFHSPKSTPRPSSRTIHLRYMHKRLHEAPRSIDERCFSALGR